MLNAPLIGFIECVPSVRLARIFTAVGRPCFFSEESFFVPVTFRGGCSVLRLLPAAIHQNMAPFSKLEESTIGLSSKRKPFSFVRQTGFNSIRLCYDAKCSLSFRIEKLELSLRSRGLER